MPFTKAAWNGALATEQPSKVHSYPLQGWPPKPKRPRSPSVLITTTSSRTNAPSAKAFTQSPNVPRFVRSIAVFPTKTTSKPNRPSSRKKHSSTRSNAMLRALAVALLLSACTEATARGFFSTTSSPDSTWWAAAQACRFQRRQHRSAAPRPWTAAGLTLDGGLAPLERPPDCSESRPRRGVARHVLRQKSGGLQLCRPTVLRGLRVFRASARANGPNHHLDAVDSKPHLRCLYGGGRQPLAQRADLFTPSNDLPPNDALPCLNVPAPRATSPTKVGGTLGLWPPSERKLGGRRMSTPPPLLWCARFCIEGLRRRTFQQPPQAPSFALRTRGVRLDAFWQIRKRNTRR